MARGLKSGLELAAETLGHAWQSLRRRKIARRLSVQVVLSAVFCFKFKSFQDLSSQVNGKNGGHGPTAQLHVARGIESGLELAVGVMLLVQESQQRLKIAFWPIVQVDFSPTFLSWIFFLHMSDFFFPNVLMVSFVSPVFSISTLNYFNLCCQLVWSACQHQIAYILKFCIKQLLRGMSFLIWRFRLEIFTDIHSSYTQSMARMGWMGPMLDFVWQGNQNQGSSLQQKWWFLSGRAHRHQILPCGRLSRLCLLQNSLFIGPKSYHCLPCSVSHWLLLLRLSVSNTHLKSVILTLSQSYWCDSCLQRYQLSIIQTFQLQLILTTLLKSFNLLLVFCRHPVFI